MDETQIGTPELTPLLKRWRAGDRSVEAALVGAIYPQLCDLARAYRRRHGAALTLDPTELVNESYARLVRQQSTDWQNRAHFAAIAATVVRRTVVDHLRGSHRVKRGKALPWVSLDESEAQSSAASPEEEIDWLLVDAALTRLGDEDQDAARVVELKFFAGMSTEQIAEALDVSISTVVRRWRFAKAWLSVQMGQTSGQISED
jgi:RNA polymerase sigma factor (TIGR02999 family)